MHSQTWKQFERDAAAFMGGERFPANQGGPIDGESPQCYSPPPGAIWQCKKKTSLSHRELAREVVKMFKCGEEKGKMGCVLHQVPRQKDCPSVKMITMSWEMFDEWFSMRKVMRDPAYHFPWADEEDTHEQP